MAGLDSAYQPSCPRTKLLRLRDLLHDGDTGDQALALVEELLHSDLDQPSTTAEDDPSSRFFDNNHAMMLLLDPATGCLVDANPAAAKYYGWSREEMRGKPIFEINTLSRQEIKIALGEAVEGKRNLFHFLHRRADGSLCNVDILSGKIRYHGRELLYSIVHDAGERRAAEEKLAEERQRLEFILEAAEYGTWEWQIPRLEGTINHTLASMLGYSAEELEPMTLDRWKSLCHPEDYLRAQTLLDDALSGDGKLFECEMRLRHKSGHWVWTLSRGQVMTRDSEGRPLQMFGTLTSIQKRKERETEREVLREHLMQAKKMESVGRLAGGIAHDFNNLLTVILGNAQTSLSSLDQRHPLWENLTEIEEAAHKSAQLTRQLLAFARQQPAHPQLLSLDQDIENMLETILESLGKQVEFKWRPASDGALVKLDPIQLNQLMDNLIRNSEDSISDDGVIEISTFVETVSQNSLALPDKEKPGRYVVISIKDNGKGMSPEVLDRLFEPFFTTKGFGQGKGLGLATVDGIVNQNLGFIRVRSRVGEGSVFEVFLPLVEGAKPVSEGSEPTTKARLSQPRGTETVLVVEDEPTVLKLAQRALERCGYKVLTAAEPEEGIDLFRVNKGSIDLLLTDVMMPGMNGPEMARIIQRESPGLRCLYMSGYSAEVIAERGLLDRSVHIIEKPFSIKELSRRVRELLDTP